MTSAELSRFLFSPMTLVLYLGAAMFYLRAMAAPTLDAVVTDAAGSGQRRDGSGSTALRWGTGLAVLGVLAHTAHVVVRTSAAGRLPLGNMFEFSSIIALTIVVGGLTVIQWRMRRPELMGFVMLGALVTLVISLLLYSDPAPLQPILDTWWRAIHVSTIALSAGIFSLAAVFNALHLLRDTAESRVAERAGESFGANTVGAAQAPTDVDAGGDDVARGGAEDADPTVDALPSRVEPDVLDLEQAHHDEAYRGALRAVLTQRWLGLRLPWRIMLGSIAVGVAFSLIWWDVEVSLATALTMAVLTLVAWWAVPYLPSATSLDSLTYRTIAFSFPIWTFAVITGAMWAEQSWGRFWGWDPKETSAFVTWIAYAGYLHARATRGVKGRKASWLGLVAYGVLLFTYYAVNLLIVGLHSYGGIDQTVG